MIVWRTAWLLLRFNLEHMCGLQLSVQLPQGGELARDRVDADGTVFVQDGVSEQREQREVVTVFTENLLGKMFWSYIDLGCFL